MRSDTTHLHISTTGTTFRPPPPFALPHSLACGEIAPVSEISEGMIIRGIPGVSENHWSTTPRG